MKVQDAVLILEQLKRNPRSVIPIEADSSYPHSPERVVRDRQSGAVIIKYVKRLEYMKWLQHKFNLVEKGSNLRDNIIR